MLRNEQGASLIEIIVALVIFALGVSMAMRTLPDSNSVTNKSRNMTKATNLAQQKLEELLALSYDHGDLNAGTHNDASNPVDVHYNRSWVVAANTPVTDMKRIQVSVIYPPAGASDVVTLTTSITAKR